MHEIWTMYGMMCRDTEYACVCGWGNKDTLK